MRTDVSSRPAAPWATLWATWFGCGYFPKGPGTAGSVGALIVAAPLAWLGTPPWGYALLALGVTTRSL